MNNNIKHYYCFNILKNVKQNIVQSTLWKFFNSRNDWTRNFIILEKNKEINILFLNFVFRKNKKIILRKFRKIRNISKSRKLQNLPKIRKITKRFFVSIAKKIKIVSFIRNLILKKIAIQESKLRLKLINAQILAKIISNNLKKNRFRKVKNKIKKFFRFQENSWNANVKGLKICIHGRLNRDRIRPRKSKTSFTKGRFKGCNFIDKGNVLIRNRKGHYKIRVFIGIKLPLFSN